MIKEAFCKFLLWMKAGFWAKINLALRLPAHPDFYLLSIAVIQQIGKENSIQKNPAGS